MRLDPKGWPRWVRGPLSIVVHSALISGGLAFAAEALKKEICTIKEHRQNERRYVSIFTKEDPLTRWRLPAIVSVRKIQDELCTTNVYRHIDTVYWPDGAQMDFEDCLFLGNLVGDCVDEQGHHWRVKVFAKTTDEIPQEHNYPESSIPNIRRLWGEQ